MGTPKSALRSLAAAALLATSLVPAGTSVSAGSLLDQRSVSVELRELTVPSAALPEGCGLMSRDEVAPYRREGNRLIAKAGYQPPGVTDNPWFGNQFSVLRYLRQMFGVARVSPDAPVPQDERNLLLTHGIVEGYSAVYAAADEEPIVVSAIRVTAASPAAAGIRLDDGKVLAVIKAGSGPCSEAVRRFIGTLAKGGGST